MTYFVISVVFSVVEEKIGFIGFGYGHNDKSRLRDLGFFDMIPDPFWGIGDAGYRGAHPKLKTEFP